MNADVKNVLLVHERFAPDFAGGGEYVVLKTAQHLMANGLNVRVLTTGDPDNKRYEGVETRRIPISTYRFNLAWKSAVEAGAGADVIHGFSYHGILPSFIAGTYLRKPVVCEVLALFDDAWIEMKGPWRGRAFRLMERLLLSLPVDARIYLSRFSYDLAKRRRLSRGNDYIIEPGISLEDYRPGKKKSYVLFSGKLDVRKGVERVLESAHRLPDVPFKIIGWGTDEETLKKRSPSNVEIISFQNRLQLAEAMSKARIFVFPTQAETFGLAVAEAMASGCAVVSSSKLHFAGIRISFDDTAAMTDAIRALWNDPSSCRRMGELNYRLSRRLDWQRHISSLLKAYADVARRKI